MENSRSVWTTQQVPGQALSQNQIMFSSVYGGPKHLVAKAGQPDLHRESQASQCYKERPYLKTTKTNLFFSHFHVFRINNFTRIHMANLQ